MLTPTEPVFGQGASSQGNGHLDAIGLGNEAQSSALDRQHETPVPLRVALLTNSLSPHTLPLCQAMSERVQDFEAFISADADRFHRFPRVRGRFAVTVQKSFNALRFLRRSNGHWHTNEIQIPYDTFRQLKRFRPDVILSNQLGVRTILSALYRRRNPEARLFLWATLSAHTEQNRAWYRRTIRQWIIRNIDGVFTNGSEGEQYVRSLGFSGPVFTMPYTIDNQLFHRKNYDPQAGRIRLFYCGRMDAQKGIRTFTEALVRWCSAHPELSIELQMVGDGPDVASIRSMVTGPNLRILLTPRLTQEELAPFYQKADLFVLPTFEDEWGVVVNEAMSAGLPVLGSIYSQAVAELVQDGVSGWTYDPHSGRSTDDALTRALQTSPDALQRLSRNAQAKVAEISPERVASRAVAAMRSVVQCSSSPISHKDATIAERSSLHRSKAL